MSLIDGNKVHKNDIKEIGKEIGKRLKKLRKSKKISLFKIEKDLKINKSVIKMIESGQRMISVNEAKKLAKYLDVSPELLISNEII